MVFVPRCVARLSRDPMAPVVGTLAGLLLLPINNVSVFNVPYPTGQAIYLLPLLVFLVLVFVVPGAAEWRGFRWGLLVGLVSVAVSCSTDRRGPRRTRARDDGRDPVGLPSDRSRPSRRTFLRIVAALAVQMAVVHMPPYVYRGSVQVGERSYVDHEVAFEHRDPAVAWAGLRGGPNRYVDAIYGTSFAETTPSGLTFHGIEASVPFDVLGHNVTDYYGSDRYVAYTAANVRIEAGLYDGLRYSRREFENFETARGVHRVQSNGEFWLYYVNASA